MSHDHSILRVNRDVSDGASPTRCTEKYVDAILLAITESPSFMQRYRIIGFNGMHNCMQTYIAWSIFQEIHAGH